jgi:hypothetical protein
MTDFYSLQFSKYDPLQLQILLQELRNLLRQFPRTHNGGGFLQLANRSISTLRYFLHVLEYVACLYLSYHPYYLVVYQEKDEQDLHKGDYRNDGERVNYLKYFRLIVHKIRGENEASFYLKKLVRIHLIYDLLSIPSILSHCRTWWISACQLFPKSVQYLLCYTLFAYQTPVLVANPRRMSFRAGLSNFSNYTIGVV